MKLYILGACGTFMAGIANIARQLGHEIIGFDANVYPPMSDQLLANGIQLVEGYAKCCDYPSPDQIIVGNAIIRGNPALEHALNQNWNIISGPQWLYESVLSHRQVIAVAGTHW